MSNSIEGRSTVDGIIWTWNPAAEQIYGYSSEEMIGKSTTCIIPEDRLAEPNANWVKVKNGQSVAHFETLRVKKDGLTVVVSVSTSPICDASGEIIGICSIAREMTEQKHAQDLIAKQQGMELQRMAEHDRLVELERFQRLTVGRERQMIKMKKEIEDLKKLVPADRPNL